jgi:hypothetical protein
MMPMQYTPSRATILACLLPIAVIGIGIAAWGVNIPYVDQLWFVRIIKLSREGALTLRDLFAQANQHRPFIPRLLWLGLASVSRYDVRLELWANLLIATATFTFMAAHVVRTWRRFEVLQPSLLLPLMSFLVFNWAQWEGWLNGFQTVFYLSSACTVTGFLLLAEEPTGGRFALAALAGTVGTFSGANALSFWPIGLALVLLAAPAEKRLLRAALWSTVGAAVIFLFAAGWQAPPDLRASLLTADLLPRAYWVTNFLGAPLMTVPHLAFPFGLLSIGLFAYVIWHVARGGQWRPLLPYFAIAGFAVASGLVISLGRMRLGIVQSVGAGYLTISAWYWCALLAILPLVPLRRVPARVLYSLIMICLLWLTAWGGSLGQAYGRRLMRAHETAVVGGIMSDEVMQNIAQPGTYDKARDALRYLQQNELSAYAERP